MAIHPTALVDPSAKLGEDVEIGAYAFVGPNVTLGAGAVLEHHASVHKDTTLGAGCHIWPFASLGGDPQDLKYKGEDSTLEVGERTVVRECATLNRGSGHGGGATRVGSDCLIMAYAHVAHDCMIGNHVVMANSVNLAGHVTLMDHCALGGMTAVHQFVRIGVRCFVGGMSAVDRDLPPYCLCEGNRAVPRGINTIGLKRAGFSPEVLEGLKKAYRIIFRNRTSLAQVLEKARQEAGQVKEVEELIGFFEASERGVSR